MQTSAPKSPDVQSAPLRSFFGLWQLVDTVDRSKQNVCTFFHRRGINTVQFSVHGHVPGVLS